MVNFMACELISIKLFIKKQQLFHYNTVIAIMKFVLIILFLKMNTYEIASEPKRVLMWHNCYDLIFPS